MVLAVLRHTVLCGRCSLTKWTVFLIKCSKNLSHNDTFPPVIWLAHRMVFDHKSVPLSYCIYACKCTYIHTCTYELITQCTLNIISMYTEHHFHGWNTYIYLYTVHPPGSGIGTLGCTCTTGGWLCECVLYCLC